MCTSNAKIFDSCTSYCTNTAPQLQHTAARLTPLYSKQLNQGFKSKITFQF